MLADYGKNPNISFEYMHQKEQSFTMNNICMLEIDSIELSLDGKFLAVVCGIPEKKIIFVDVEKRQVLKGMKNYLPLGKEKVRKIEFNPANHRTFAVMFENKI